MAVTLEGKDLGACLGLTTAAKAAKVHLVYLKFLKHKLLSEFDDLMLGTR